ncbi:pseudoazurin [Gammaproteobacteria bacterium]|nr:pseudoazurin [Gammaproteobacteria bacterium]MDB9854746.1 pseudoazurin [Gammaproteobacteria bacterium]
MKKITPLFVVTLALVLFFNGKKYDELLGSRLNNSVSVCLEGQPCGAASSAAVSSAANSAPIVKVQLSEGSEHIVKMLNSGEGGQMIFEPAVLKVSLGDTIHFKATDAAHNSVSMDGMIPSGGADWAGKLSQDISVVLDTEGVYVYQCDPHVMMAMIGVIQVGEAVNLEDIKMAAADKKSAFMMNSERLDNYLSQL